MVHYAFGAFTGAFYGALSELEPGAAGGAGVPFGAAVWLIADEMGVPLAGFAGAPNGTARAARVCARLAPRVRAHTGGGSGGLLLGRSYDGALNQ